MTDEALKPLADAIELAIGDWHSSGPLGDGVTLRRMFSEFLTAKIAGAAIRYTAASEIDERAAESMGLSARDRAVVMSYFRAVRERI